ncbi:MAG: phosphodiester glycosidase family protein [Kofleriaceae bacterium]
MRFAFLAVVGLAGSAAAAPTMTSQSDPHPGIHLERWTDSAIPAKLVLVRIDLTSAEIAVYTTKEADKGITTSTAAQRMTAQVAINGDAFAALDYTPRGLALGDSTPWTNTADSNVLPLMHVRRVGERTTATIVPPEIVVGPDDLPAGTQGAISGRPLLVRAGNVAPQFDCADPVTLSCQRAPRSAVAVSSDGNTMWLVTVDGWQSGSVGMTAAELAQFLDARGAHMAMALDSGSSATMVVDGTLATMPSDGVERRVANHIAVKYGALPKGELVGLVCANSITNCTRLTGAIVTLDDGRMQTTGSDGFYDFTGITPRLACITAKKTGYKTKQQCAIVESSMQNFNSIVLEPGTDPVVDAGVPDAPGPDDDAGVPPGDGGMDPDGGIPDMGDGGGCCDAGRERPPIAIVLGVALGWMLRRRRGTNV